MRRSTRRRAIRRAESTAHGTEDVTVFDYGFDQNSKAWDDWDEYDDDDEEDIDIEEDDELDFLEDDPQFDEDGVWY